MSITLVCFLVQIVCLLSISYTKVKYVIEDNKSQRSTAMGPILNLEVDEENPRRRKGLKNSKESTQRGKGLKNSIEPMEMMNPKNPPRTNDLNKWANLNTVAHNKTFVEVYHISLLVLVIIVNLASVAIKKQFQRKVSVTFYFQELLCFLDLAPRISLSLILPIAILIFNPAIQQYIKRFFKGETR